MVRAVQESLRGGVIDGYWVRYVIVFLYINYFMKGVFEMNERSNSVIKTVPAASALHSVPMFDPLKLLRMTTSAKTGEKVLRLDLSYKKMWFLLVHPRGRMLTNILRVTDQMAIFEAQLYADRDDDTVLAQFTSCHTRRESGPQYIRNAQNEALNEALDNAGFGIQLSDLVEHDDSGYGSEVLLSQVEALLRDQERVESIEPTISKQAEGSAHPAPTQTAAGQTTSHEQEQEPAPQQEQEKPMPVQKTSAAPSAKPDEKADPVVKDVPTQTAEAPQADTASDTETSVNSPEPMEEAASEPSEGPQPNDSASSVSTETASVLQMLGGIPAAAGGQTSEQSGKSKVTERPTVVAFPQAEESAPAAEAEEQSAPQDDAEPDADAAVSYTEDMTVDEIRARMTIEQAKSLTVSFGPNKGWTLGQVQDRRPSSLKFYALVSTDASNAIKAGSFLLLDELAQARAG